MQALGQQQVRFPAHRAKARCFGGVEQNERRAATSSHHHHHQQQQRRVARNTHRMRTYLRDNNTEETEASSPQPSMQELQEFLARNASSASSSARVDMLSVIQSPVDGEMQ